LISLCLNDFLESASILNNGLKQIVDQKDQERTILVTLTALSRLELITESLKKSSTPSLNLLGKVVNYTFSGLFLINIVTTLNKPLLDEFDSYLNKKKQESLKDSLQTSTIDYLIKLSAQYRNFINSNCYVKLLDLNKKVVNACPDLITLAIGGYFSSKFCFEKKPENLLNVFASLLIFFKEYQLLPKKLDSLLFSNLFLLHSYSNYTSLSKNYHSKDWSFSKMTSSLNLIISLFENASRSLKQGANFTKGLKTSLNQLLHKTVDFQEQDKHVVWESRENIKLKWFQIKKLNNDPFNDKDFLNSYFTTNLSSNFIDNAFLSPELTEKVKTSDVKPLIERSEKLISSTTYNENGWKTLKTALIEKKIPDHSIEEVDVFISCLKAIFISTLDNEELNEQEKIKKIHELAELGDSCPEGWLNDFIFALDNKSNDYKWVIRDFLSTQRSFLGLETIAQSLPNWVTAIFGASNNTHFVNALSQLMENKSPTKITQLNNMLSPPDFMNSFVKTLSALSCDFRDNNASRRFIHSLELTPWMFFGLQKYSPHYIIESVYEINRPFFVLKEGHYTDDRVFSKVAFFECLKECDNLGIEYLDENTGKYNEDLIEHNKVGNKETLCFSKKGIALILWKMGIIECTDSSECYPVFSKKFIHDTLFENLLEDPSLTINLQENSQAIEVKDPVKNKAVQIACYTFSNSKNIHERIEKSLSNFYHVWVLGDEINLSVYINKGNSKEIETVAFKVKDLASFLNEDPKTTHLKTSISNIAKEKIDRSFLETQTDPESQLRYAMMCYKGKGGEKDFLEARKSFILSAEQGNAKAQYSYAVMCYQGTGTGKKPDFITARKYFKLAADNGFTEGLKMYREMKNLGQGLELHNATSS
jgi:TPR repeat protein